MADRRHQSDHGAHEIPGDTEAADIVGRTGEEMPEVAHDEVDRGRMKPDELVTFEEEVVQGDPSKPQKAIAPTDPASMPRDDDHPGGLKDSLEFHDRPAPVAPASQRREGGR